MERASCVPSLLVPSGSYIVTTREDHILEAHLGTCVGVSLFDRHSSVGGLIHLLLPEPTGANEQWQPAVYASTGLPLFIRALLDAGASKSALQAHLAGGALVEPLSEKDLFLNIGGRTTEIVEEILWREGIPVFESETGGFFTCRLILNTQTWESRVEPFPISPPRPDARRFKRPSLEELQTAVEHVRPIPQAALKVIGMIRNAGYSMKDMAEEIRQDQVISAKALRLCNSAFFSPIVKIDSIDRALAMIGEKKLVQLLLSASLRDFFPKTAKGYSLCKGGLFRHAVGTAAISEKLAEVTGKGASAVAYTAGLLHDIGKVVLDQYMAPVFPLFYRRTQMDGSDLVEVEQDTLGLTHPEAGSKLAEQWSFPETLMDTIRYHHCPEKATVQPELTHLVYIADLLMSRFLVGQELDRLDTKELAGRLRILGLSSKSFSSLVESIAERIMGLSLGGFVSFSHI